MFDFFKRAPRPSPGAVHTNRANPQRVSNASRALASLEPLPIPEVSEGNTEADWSMWEDSVAFQNSQMPQYDEVTVPAELAPKQDDDNDPFSKLPKHTL